MSCECIVYIEYIIIILFTSIFQKKYIRQSHPVMIFVKSYIAMILLTVPSMILLSIIGLKIRLLSFYYVRNALADKNDLSVRCFFWSTIGRRLKKTVRFHKIGKIDGYVIRVAVWSLWSTVGWSSLRSTLSPVTCAQFIVITETWNSSDIFLLFVKSWSVWYVTFVIGSESSHIMTRAWHTRYKRVWSTHVLTEI